MDLKSQMTRKASGYEFSSPTIVYCPTKKMTMEVTSVLSGQLSSAHMIPVVAILCACVCVCVRACVCVCAHVCARLYS